MVLIFRLVGNFNKVDKKASSISITFLDLYAFHAVEIRNVSIRSRNRQTSKTPLDSQAQGTSLFTSAVTNHI